MRKAYIATRVGYLVVRVASHVRASVILPNLDHTRLHVVCVQGRWKRADGKPPTILQQAIIDSWSCKAKLLDLVERPACEGAGSEEMIAERNQTDRYVVLNGEHFRLTLPNFKKLMESIAAGEKPDPTKFRCAELSAPIYLDEMTPAGAQAILNGGTVEDAMNAQAGVPAIQDPPEFVSKSEAKRQAAGRGEHFLIGGGPPSTAYREAEGVAMIPGNVPFNEDSDNNI